MIWILLLKRMALLSKRGRPVAFIEAAWRRYTKHSRNKAQEIQGAVLPIAEKYERDAPFLGAVLAGVFTEGAIEQLKSVNFEVVYLSYETIISAFRFVGINAEFDEDTSDSEFAKCITQIDRLPPDKRRSLKTQLLSLNKKGFDDFFASLRAKLDRIIERIVVLALFGNTTSFVNIGDAEQFIDKFNGRSAVGEFQKFEIIIIFSNKDEIKGIFASKDRAKEFLRYLT